MMKKHQPLLYLLTCLSIAATQLSAMELGGWVSLQGQVFADEGADGQQRANLSFATQPEMVVFSEDGIWTFQVEPFVRYDAQDKERSHIDVREAHALAVYDNWEWKIGISREFWGATEFRHLVDVINQTDLVENIDGEDKLGQTMLKATWFTEWGLWEAFVLPGFRERRFAGQDGRLRPALPVDSDAARFTSGAGRTHVDVATRLSGSLGPVDLGLAYFQGTNRDPLLVPDPARGRLVPVYEQMRQFSLDATAVAGQTIWKLEALVRDSDRERYVAATGGMEYTIVGLAGTSQDLGLLAEYIWDERGEDAQQLLQNDLAIGLRWTPNDIFDSALLFGYIQDLQGGGRILSLEWERRLDDHLSVTVEARMFTDTAGDPSMAALDQDDMLQAELFYHF